MHALQRSARDAGAGFDVGRLEIPNRRNGFTAEDRFVEPGECPPIIGNQVCVDVLRTFDHAAQHGMSTRATPIPQLGRIIALGPNAYPNSPHGR
jgi:hypothetical protein